MSSGPFGDEDSISHRQMVVLKLGLAAWILYTLLHLLYVLYLYSVDKDDPLPRRGSVFKRHFVRAIVEP